MTNRADEQLDPSQTKPTEDNSVVVSDQELVITQELMNQIARETYLWLDEWATDREEKDLATLEAASHIVIG